MSADGNLGPREQNKRLVFGVAMLVVALTFTAALLWTGAGRWWRLVLFAPFFLAGHGLFQAHGKT